jgi:hypothetical protein
MKAPFLAVVRESAAVDLALRDVRRTLSESGARSRRRALRRRADRRA